MSGFLPPIIFLSGASGVAPDVSLFQENAQDITRFEVIEYPGWKRYVAEGFSAEKLIDDLVERIATRVPRGPVRIVGLSIGGHFGYAAALRFQAMGREVGGLCAIDSFMISSSKPSAGWKTRALRQASELIREKRFGEFIRFLRSKCWRGLARLAGDELPSLVQAVSSSRLNSIAVVDPILEQELSMRLLIREVAPWIASLDREPVPLRAPAILLRTRLTADDDAAWRRRCPNVSIFEIPGQHHTLFESENIGSLRETFLAATWDWR